VSGPTTAAAPPLRIGTRGSALALIQAGIVHDALAATGVEVVLETIVTDGDRRAADTPWGEGAFVTAIEAALRDGRIDIAVHSAKDVPTDEDPALAIAALLSREDPRDVVVLSEHERIAALADLPEGARVGTDSPRRTAFLRAIRPDLRVHPLHGNVDTRLRRLDAGETDALVLAAAGLRRLGRTSRITLALDPEVVPPAPGQGALAVQVRRNDERTRALVGILDDPSTRRAVEAERTLLADAGGGCRAPLGARAQVVDDDLQLLGGYAREDGSLAVVRTRSGNADTDDTAVVTALLADLARAAAEAASGRGEPRVIVTRSADQSAPTLLALVDRGLAPLSVPTIEIVAGDEAGLDAAIADLAAVDRVVVTSVNAVHALEASARRCGRPLAGTPGSARPRWAAVGRTTERSLRRAGVVADVRPARASGAALAEAIPIVPGERVLLPRGDLADEVLPERLRERGAVVRTVVAYRTVEAPPASASLLERALGSAPDVIVATSGSTVRGLLALATSIDATDAVRRLPVVAIGPETAAEARRLGFVVAAEAPMQASAGIAEVAARLLGHDQEDR
jgi:hydroxymethylbilane synthase